MGLATLPKLEGAWQLREPLDLRRRTIALRSPQAVPATTSAGARSPDVKNSFTDIVGFFAGAIDKARNDQGFKRPERRLRLHRASAPLGYAALITTANAMGESCVASSAEELLEDCGGLMADVARALPEIVVQELALFGLSTLAPTALVSAQQAERAWQRQDRQQERSAQAATEIGLGWSGGAKIRRGDQLILAAEFGAFRRDGAVRRGPRRPLRKGAGAVRFMEKERLGTPRRCAV